MDYLSHIRDALVQPLTSQGVEGVQDVVALMDAYYLMKEDFENIMEISSWGGKPSPFSKLDPKVNCVTQWPPITVHRFVLGVPQRCFPCFKRFSFFSAFCFYGLCFPNIVFEYNIKKRLLDLILQFVCLSLLYAEWKSKM